MSNRGSSSRSLISSISSKRHRVEAKRVTTSRIFAHVHFCQSRGGPPRAMCLKSRCTINFAEHRHVGLSRNKGERIPSSQGIPMAKSNDTRSIPTEREVPNKPERPKDPETSSELRYSITTADHDAPNEHEPSHTPRTSDEVRASIEATLVGLIAVARAVGYTDDDLIELFQRGILK